MHRSWLFHLVAPTSRGFYSTPTRLLIKQGCEACDMVMDAEVFVDFHHLLSDLTGGLVLTKEIQEV